MVEGRSNKEIGRRLDLAEKTVKHHVTNILQKLKARNRVEAVLMVSRKSAQDPVEPPQLIPSMRHWAFLECCWL